MDLKPPSRRSIRLTMPDRPGALADVTAVLAGLDIDIVRLEVWPGDEEAVHDDLTLESANLDEIHQAVRDLRGRGFTVSTLPDHWWLRDWAHEVFEAVQALDVAASQTEELDIVLDAACRLANTSHSVVVNDAPGGEPSGYRVERLSHDFDPGWITWTGPDHAVSGIQTMLGPVRPDRVDRLAPVDAVHGLAVEIPGMTAAGAYLGVVGVRPPFLPAETTRVERYAALVGRLHPVERALESAPA